MWLLNGMDINCRADDAGNGTREVQSRSPESSLSLLGDSRVPHPAVFRVRVFSRVSPSFGGLSAHPCCATHRSLNRPTPNQPRYARALSIISSQMPLDRRITSMASRTAPLPASAVVV